MSDEPRPGEEPRPGDEPMSDAAPGDLAQRGTPLSLALGFETLADRACAMRVPFRADLVGDPAVGALAGGVIFALLDQACGMAIGLALRDRDGVDGPALRPNSIATLDFRLDHVRPPRAGAAMIGEAECLRLTGDVAVVRAWAYEDDPADPVAAAQAAFMLTNTPTAA
jgi:acyl-coenzyme A thioesterase PaaI-like protein